jgi:hypothetical protein
VRVWLGLVALVAVRPLAGQDSTITRPAPSHVVAADTTTHHPQPFGYFARSLLIPGWGQAALDRKLTGGLFIAFEGLAISMALKTGSELQYLTVADTATATHHRAERQDWLVLIGFNHLFSALEAYVSAHLIDFPRGLGLKALPGGRTGLGYTVKLPH